MMLRGLLFGVILLLAGPVRAGDPPEPVKKDDLYPIYEHGGGRWLAFVVPLQPRHEFQTPGLADYKLRMKVSLLVSEGKQAKVELTFTEEGTFKPVIRPRMPGTSHVDLYLGDQSVARLALTHCGSTNEGDRRLIHASCATIPLRIFQKMLVAKAVQGYLYWCSENEIVEGNELRSFTLDTKVLRTLAALDAQTR